MTPPHPSASDATPKALHRSPRGKTRRAKRAAAAPQTPGSESAGQWFDARRIALTVLDRLDQGRLTLDTILEDVNRQTPELQARDRSLAYALIFGVLRWRSRLDWTIHHFSKTPLSRIDPSILNILRIGLYQIANLDRVPLSAAVNTAVEMAKSKAPAWVARYVNAVLRNAARVHGQVPLPALAENPVEALAVCKSFPPWLLQRWLRRLGLSETQEFCDALNRIPPITLRTNSLKISRADLIQALKDEAAKVAPTPYSACGIHLTAPRCAIDRMPAFHRGWFQVQDEAAQLVTCLLDPRPGETVLDACAGLGGKTGHIAQLMANQGRVLALDHNPEKLGQLQREMRRLGLDIIQTRSIDLDSSIISEQFPLFDRILLDAPCSGLGVLRRNPDSKWLASEDKILQSADRQLRLLHNLSPLLKPSGILVFAVCSLEPEENETVINAFLKNHAEFAMEELPAGSADGIRAAHSADGFYRTWPHRHDTDGFFAAILRKVS